MKLWLRISISVGLLAWLLSRHDFLGSASPHFAALQENLHWVAAGLGCMGASVFFNSLRWWLLLRHQCPGLGFSAVFQMTLVGWFFSITSIGTLGADAYRILAVSKRSTLSKAEAGVSVLVEHVAGFLGTIILFAISAAAALWYWSVAPPELLPLVRRGAAGLAGCAVVLGFGVYTLTPAFFDKYHAWAPRLLLPYFKRIADAQRGYAMSWGTFLAATLTSVLVLLTYFLTFYCGVHAVGGSVDCVPILLAMPAVDLLSALPLSISGLGVREQSFEFLMRLLAGLAPQTSIAGSLIGWLFSLAWGLLGGLLYVRGKATQPHMDPNEG
jgi:glycosyltransferase 2 family protein